jgi:class 3 adenylate cyclase
MRDIRHAHFQQARRLIQRHGGYEIKTIGDAFMVAFRRATDGLRFSLELHGGTGHKLVKVRAGVHVGPVDIEEQDAFGAMVNYAARVIGAAKGAEVWVSQQAKEDVLQEKSPELAQLQWMEHPDCELKGFKGRYVLWSIALPEP